MLKRIIGNLILVFAIYFLPWWVVLAILLFAVFYFNFFVEAIFYAVYLDFVFSRPFENFWDFPFLISVFVFTILLFSFYIKDKILLYEK